MARSGRNEGMLNGVCLPSKMPTMMSQAHVLQNSNHACACVICISLRSFISKELPAAKRLAATLSNKTQQTHVGRDVAFTPPLPVLDSHALTYARTQTVCVCACVSVCVWVGVCVCVVCVCMWCVCVCCGVVVTWCHGVLVCIGVVWWFSVVGGGGQVLCVCACLLGWVCVCVCACGCASN